MKAAGWIVRHWRGGFDLARSFWLHASLPWALVFALLALAVWCVAVEGAALQAAGVLLVVLTPVWLALSVWAGVGTWRAARAHQRAGGSARVCWAARLGLMLGAAFTTATLVVDALPPFSGWLALAAGSDVKLGLQSQLSADGQTLRWQGAIAQGDAARARGWLAAAPQLQLLELDASGGRLNEARQIAQALAPRGVAVRVTGTCVDACWLVFMAGRSRQATAAARLGFKRAAADAWWPGFGRLARAHVAARYREAGLPDALIDRALGGLRSTTWWLDEHDVQASGLVGVPGRPWDVDLPFSADAPLASYTAALNTNRLWRAAEARSPGSLGAAALQLRQARLAGVEGDKLQAEAQRPLQPLWAPLLAQADVSLRETYVIWLADGVRALVAADPQGCAQFLAGDALARRQLPPELRAAEADWWLAVLTEPASSRPARALTPLETEVARRTLGAAAMQVLIALRPWPARAPASCARVSSLLGEVLALPVPERRLALRLVALP